ncbi:MAG: MBL fold metallo-hydrolase [Spirochaetia bacterium]|nr:MBL fold metallo-hydrolase [Spirochaetia bacterium]
MKKRHVFALFLLLLLILNYGLSRIGSEIPISGDKLTLLNRPAVATQRDVQVYKIDTGFAETLEAFVLSGGSFFKLQKAAHMAALVLHPRGNLLIDTGLGKDIDSQFAEFPWWAKPLFQYSKRKSAKQTLDEKKIPVSRILLTHLHWDHASGLKDFPDSAIYTTRKEFEFAESVDAKAPAYIKSQYDGKEIQWNMIEFNSGAYEIFSESHDLYADASVVVVPLPGHTPGSIGIFVNLSPKERYFFVGDLVWSARALQKPAAKHYISSTIVDFDQQLIYKQIVKIHEFLKERPEIHVIPTHDPEAFSSIQAIP